MRVKYHGSLNTAHGKEFNVVDSYPCAFHPCDRDGCDGTRYTLTQDWRSHRSLGSEGITIFNVRIESFSKIDNTSEGD